MLLVQLPVLPLVLLIGLLDLSLSLVEPPLVDLDFVLQVLDFLKLGLKGPFMALLSLLHYLIL